MRTKKEAQQAIADQMQELRKSMADGKMPSDAEITRFAHLFYERDHHPEMGGADVEMLAVERGIAQGMKMMRSLIETVHLEA